MAPGQRRDEERRCNAPGVGTFPSLRVGEVASLLVRRRAREAQIPAHTPQTRAYFFALARARVRLPRGGDAVPPCLEEVRRERDAAVFFAGFFVDFPYN